MAGIETMAIGDNLGAAAGKAAAEAMLADERIGKSIINAIVITENVLAITAAVRRIVEIFSPGPPICRHTTSEIPAASQAQ